MRNELQESIESIAQRVTRHGGGNGDAVAIGDRAGIVEWTNSAWQRVTGWALEDVVGKPVGHMLDAVGLEPEVLDFIQSRFIAGMRASVEVPVETPDGRQIHIHLDVEPIRDETGDVGHFVAVATDVTARREAEFALESSRGRAPLRDDSSDDGSDARVVAAEAFAARSLVALRRIEQLCLEVERTTAIGLLDEFGIRSVRDRATRAVDAAIESIERASEAPPASRSADLGETVHRALRLVRRDLPKRAQFDVVLASSLPRVWTDERELGDAVERLLGAGLRALDGNWDTLSVTTGITTPGQPLISSVHFQTFAGPLRDEKPRCFIEIHDTGSTIPPDQLRRLRGGLLPMPRSTRLAELLEIRVRLRECGIEMDVSSTPGCGTRVLLLVPICD